jgi:hypothetical protein
MLDYFFLIPNGTKTISDGTKSAVGNGNNINGKKTISDGHLAVGNVVSDFYSFPTALIWPSEKVLLPTAISAVGNSSSLIDIFFVVV